MKDGDVDYSRYAITELHEALVAIRRDVYPRNYQNILAALEIAERRAAMASDEPESGRLKGDDVDYSRYTAGELREALEKIRRDSYPRNHQNILKTLAALEEAAGPDEPIAVDIPPVPDAEPVAERTGANSISPRQMAGNLLFSVLLLGYGGYGVWANDLYIPGKRGGIHLHGPSAWLMYCAMLCACLVMISTVIDRFDKRDNEINYRRFANVGKWIGWPLFAASLLMAVFKQADSAT